MLLGKRRPKAVDHGLQAPNFSPPPQSPRVDPSFSKGTTRTKLQPEERAVTQIDPEWCAKSVLLWQPGNYSALTSRPTSLYSTPKKFDRDYARKHDKDMEACLRTPCGPFANH